MEHFLGCDMTALRTIFSHLHSREGKKLLPCADRWRICLDERRKSERRSGRLPLRHHTEWITVIESAIEPIIRVNTNRSLAFFNPAACRIFGCLPEEAYGASVAKFIPEEFLESRNEQKQGEIWNGLGLLRFTPPRVLVARRSDGKAIPLEASLARVEIEGQWQWLIFLRDLSEFQEAEAMVRQLEAELATLIAVGQPETGHSREALESSNLKLQQFAYIAAHDLQAPLRSIKGFALMLQNELKGQLGTQGDTWLNHLLHSTQRMQTLIQDLLAYSQVDSHGREFEPTDFCQLFDDIVVTLDAAIRDSGAEITRDKLLPVVQGDRSQLGQLLQNLVSNGIKYCGSKAPQVHVGARREEGQWIIAVRDNGIGIPEDEQQGIFELFRRLHTQQEYPGTGIGLAVCRRVVQRHGGRIWVESEPGRGSVFYFSLPDQGNSIDSSA